MPHFSVSLGLLLAAAPLAAQAQTTAPPAPHFYVGLAAYASNFLPFGHGWQSGMPVPLQATAGYQLSPRWAVEASFAYAGRSNRYSQTLYEVTPSHTVLPYSYAGDFRQQLTTTSALARYTLTRNAAHRLRFDALGGLAWVHNAYASSYTRTDTAGVSTSEAGGYRTNNLLLNLGLGARYRLAPRLEATYSFLLGVPLAGYNVGGPHPSMALGLQYRFGPR